MKPIVALLVFAILAPLSLPAAAPEYQTWVTPAKRPTGLTTGPDGWLWSADQYSGDIHRINPSTGQSDLRATVNLHSKEYLRGIAVGNGRLWVAIYDTDTAEPFFTIWEISLADVPDPFVPVHVNTDGTELGTEKTDSIPAGLAYSNINGTEEIWIAFGGVVFAYDTSTKDRTHILIPGFDPKGIVYHEERLWVVTDGKDRRLYKIDPNGTHPTLEYPMYHGEWRGAAICDGDLWVSDRDTGTVTRYAYDLPNLFAIQYVPANLLSVPGVVGYDGNTPVWTTWDLPYLTSRRLANLQYPIDNSHIKRVVLSQHGAGSDAEGAFRNAISAARYYDERQAEAGSPTNVLGETLFLSMQLINSDDNHREVNTTAYPIDTNEYPFINAQVPHDPTLAYWSRTGGKQWGGRSHGDYGISAFAAADQLLELALKRCPNVEEIVICGHSGGGQFTQRYCALSTFEDEVAIPAGVSMRYVPMNPGNYMYLSRERHVPEDNLFGQRCDLDGGIAPPYTENVTWIEPADDLTLEKFGDAQEQEAFIRDLYNLCPGDHFEEILNPLTYSEYGLGISDFFHDATPMRFQYAWKNIDEAPLDPDNPLHQPIVDAINILAAQRIIQRYPGRCVLYCIGNADTHIRACGEDSNVPYGPRNLLQGCNRYQRACIFFAHFLKQFPDNQTHSIYEVDGISHDGWGMYRTATVQECLYGEVSHASAAWISQFDRLSMPSERAALADLDRDGKCNRLERAMNTPPHLPDGECPTIGFEEVGGNRFLTLTYRQSRRATDLELTPLGSSDLERFVDSTTELRRTSLDRNTDLVTAGDNVPVGEPGTPARRFLQLQVSERPAVPGGPQ